jgi:hypothetical protein
MAASHTLDRRKALTLLARLAINAALPVLVYVLVRPHVASDLTALIIGAAIPIAYTVAIALWQRRLDPVGTIAVAGFCAGVVLAIVTGDNEFVFKIRKDLWTGPLGLACLISVAVHRPLFLLALRLAARRNAKIAAIAVIGSPQTRRIAAVTTVVVGTILVVHAVAMIVLALVTTTTTFLAVSKPISWAISVTGLAPLLWWIRRQLSNPTSKEHDPPGPMLPRQAQRDAVR